MRVFNNLVGMMGKTFQYIVTRIKFVLSGVFIRANTI